MKEIEKAVSLLSGATTLAIVKKDSVLTSNNNGISALFEYTKADALQGASIADKIIGKAAALLMVYGKAKQVFGATLSKGAKKVFERYNIPYSYSILTDAIQNRANDGLCPMEIAVFDITEPKDAFLAVENKLKELA